MLSIPAVFLVHVIDDGAAILTSCYVIVVERSRLGAGRSSTGCPFPAPEHRWMQVEVRFTRRPGRAAAAADGRTSPGRYALHEFAKNVFDVAVANGKGAG